MIELDGLVALERQVWDALVGGDSKADAALLAADFVGVYPTGCADRQEHASQISNGPSVTEYEIHDPMMLAVAENSAMLIYRAVYRRPSFTGDIGSQEMFVSSLWTERDGTWLNIFSQDTPASQK